jgi:hypothetical protein
MPHLAGPDGEPAARSAGYYGQPILKTVPWTWEVPLYLFVGGGAGAGAVLAFASYVGGAGREVVRGGLWLAVVGVLLSVPLLVSDLGRPARFLNMLRVFKWRSPMSVGVWTLSAFGGAATLALGLEGLRAPGGLEAAFVAALVAAALLGSLVATYTGVLLGVTAVPVWNAHVRTLPLHFGAVGLGSAGAALELLGHRIDALHVLGLLAAGTETAILVWTELHRNGARDEPLRRGRSGLLVRAAGTLTGPVSLALRLSGWRALAAGLFLSGSLLSRFGWIDAGRGSAKDPAAVL